MKDRDCRSTATRRHFLRGAGLGLAGVTLGPTLQGLSHAAAVPTDTPDRPRVAAILTEFTYRSHAHVILENFLNPYLFNGERTDPGCDVVSFYVDQFPERDMARAVAAEYEIPIFDSIEQALTFGGSELAVDAVLSIGEHGRYPVNEKGQRQYPRKEFFDQIVAVVERAGRPVPVFNDKHLSYRWDWAKEMYDTARRLGIPLMAGSSVPLAQRRPPLELPDGVVIREAVSIHGGGVESYDFHGLEVLQSLVEFRRGGETGISEVQFLEGDALWRAAEQGLWSTDLADAAMACEIGPGHPTLRELVRIEPFRRQPPHGILLTYRDGLTAIVLKVGASGTRWNFACHLDGDDQPHATAFYVGPWNNRNLFKALSHAIQRHFKERRAPYPVERTLLTTGALDAAMDSRFEGGTTVATPHLEFAYEPIDFRPLREMGASWTIITEDTPQPPGLDTSGLDF